jgi:hypothetical protein
LAGVSPAHHRIYLPNDVSDADALITLAGEIHPSEPNYIVILGDWQRYVDLLMREQTRVMLETKTELISFFEHITGQMDSLKGLLQEQLALLDEIQVKLMEMNYFHSVDIPPCILAQLDRLHAGLPQCANGQQVDDARDLLVDDEVEKTLSLFGDQLFLTIDKELQNIANLHGLASNEKYANCVVPSLTESQPMKTFAPTTQILDVVGYTPMTPETIRNHLAEQLKGLLNARKASTLRQSLDRLHFRDEILTQTLDDVSAEISGLSKLEESIANSLAKVTMMRGSIGGNNFPSRPDLETRCFNEGWG